MSRLKIREISARVANLERRMQQDIPGFRAAIRDQNEMIRHSHEIVAASAKGRQEREAIWLSVAQGQVEAQAKLHHRLSRAERWSFVQSVAIVLLLGAWVWSLQ
jgi:hypothetical protein